MANSKADLLQGTLDLLILKALQHEPMHGFGVAVRIGQMSKDMLTVEQGSLYPALYRLEDQGWIKSEWGLRQQSEGEILFADDIGPEAIADRRAELGETLDGDQPGAGECRVNAEC